ncbi:MAG: MGMT family protein [Candidatus Chisholmbacteria bacterium]|nr:MGMT family protein [Candidatus Chisholmbacteria bacterium]
MNFFERVYQIVRKVPAGKVTTYGAIARSLGTKDARRVGQALHANPDEGEVPCHRVVDKDGRLAPNFAFSTKGRSAFGGDGWQEQRRRLLAEGVKFRDVIHVDLSKHLWKLE